MQSTYSAVFICYLTVEPQDHNNIEQYKKN